MPTINYGTRELTAKIVYHGPGLCGKTTNLQHIHEAFSVGGDCSGAFPSAAAEPRPSPLMLVRRPSARGV